MIVLDREALPRERTKRRDRSAVAAPAGAVSPDSGKHSLTGLPRARIVDLWRATGSAIS
jgi:hypothetical protein